MTHETTMSDQSAGQGSAGNVIAAVCSFFIPGLGHLVQGRLLGAAFFFVTCAVLYGLVITWLFALPFHLWAILSTALYKPNS